MKRKLLLIGGGGHCHSVMDSILSAGLYDEIGMVDYEDRSYFDIPVVGTDDDLPKLLKDGWTDAFITVGSVGDTSLRRRLYRMVKETGFCIPFILDPSATLAGDCVISEGVYIGKCAVVNAGAFLGAGVIINTGAIIEHDCKIGDFTHISPGTILCGQVSIGTDSHIGAGSVVRQLIRIGNNTLVGAGSVVVKDLPDQIKAYGNPCRVVE